MTISAPTFNTFQLAAKHCTQAFLKQDVSDLEQRIEACLASAEQLVKTEPSFAILLLNSSDRKLSLMENLLVKQVLTVQLFAAKLDTLPKAVKTINRACLFMLYCFTPALIKLKQNKLTQEQFEEQQANLNQLAFKLVYQLKVQDKELIKLLSQLSGNNKFKSTNQLLQTLTLLAFNTNITANMGITSEALPFNHALNAQLAGVSSWLGLEMPFINSYLTEMCKISSQGLFAGNLVFAPNFGYFLLLSQSPQKTHWYGLPFEPKTKLLSADVVKIEHYHISKAYPQFKLNHDELHQIFLEAKSDWPLEDQHFATSGYYDPVSVKYSVPEFWPKATQALLKGNIKELGLAVDSREEFRDILLTYASDMNRHQLQVQSSKHAISLLGLDRVFPIVASGMMKLVEESFRFNGSEELNNKVDFLAAIALKLGSKKSEHSLPEYHSLITRLLALSLFTIPKVGFSANNYNRKEVTLLFPKTTHICLAEIFQYEKIELWLKVTLHMIDTWKLPKILKQFLTKYLTGQKSNINVVYSPIEQEWLEMIEQTNLVFLLSVKPKLSKAIQTKVTKLAESYGTPVEELVRLARDTALELNVKTSLV